MFLFSLCWYFKNVISFVCIKFILFGFQSIEFRAINWFLQYSNFQHYSCNILHLIVKLHSHGCSMWVTLGQFYERTLCLSVSGSILWEDLMPGPCIQYHTSVRRFWHSPLVQWVGAAVILESLGFLLHSVLRQDSWQTDTTLLSQPESQSCWLFWMLNIAFWGGFYFILFYIYIRLF